MTAEARVPAEVFSLPEYLCDEMHARKMKTADVARKFDNGLTQSVNLLMLNFVMLGHTDDRVGAPQALIDGVARALGIDADFLRRLEQPWREHPERRKEWICPLDILSQEMHDYI